MTTFGDLITVADNHFATLTDALYRPDIKEQTQHPAVIAELVRCTGVLARYNRRIADNFGTHESQDQRMRRAAHRSATLIGQAQTLLGQPPPGEPDGPPLAWTLRSASQALGCGLDLLASHLPVAHSDVGRPVRGEVAVIAATDSARALLHKLSRYTAVTGRLARATGPSGREAGTLLLGAAILEGLHGDAALTPITAIPLRFTPARIPPTPGESLGDALHGLATSAERLREAHPTSSIATSRYLAMAASISSDITEHLSRQLGQRLHELDRAEIAGELTNTVAQGLRSIRSSWRSIARYWNVFAQRSGTPTTALAVDASDMVIRLGRLVYSDPAWKPGPRPSRRVQPPDRIAPTLEDLTNIGLTMIKTIEAWNIIAEHDRAAVQDLAIVTALAPSRHPDIHSSPELPARMRSEIRDKIRRMLRFYQAAHTRGRSVITELGDSILTLCPAESPTATEIDLVRRRATAMVSPNPAAQAAADFPIPLTEALSPGATPQPGRNAPHNETPAGRRTMRP